MLTDISIRNFAIIDMLHLSLRPGLNILTGETGAGKSIIIDAVGLILGGRASADVIRSGEEEAVVEAIFAAPEAPEFREILRDMGVENDGDGEILVKRTISRSGRNRVFINGGLSTGAVLERLTKLLVNIYGQHESQTLLRAENHLDILDGFAGLMPLRSAYAVIYDEYAATADALRRLREGEMEAARRIDLLSFQSEEIAAAALSPDEEESLAQELRLLANAGKLFERSAAAYDLLYGGDTTVSGLLARVRQAVAEVAEFDPSLAQVAETVESAAIQLEDAAIELRDYSSRVDIDPQRQVEVEERLELIKRLKRKYGASVSDILRYKEEIDRELDLLVNREQAQGDLARKLEDLRLKLLKAGEELSGLRREAASSFSAAMEKELGLLAMKNARLEVRLVSFDEPRQAGMEKVEFLFSPNPGEEAKALAKIASGGELSRLMLAMKQIHPESDVPTLIFDEVDTGIGGATSVVVGEKLRNVSRRQQVLCITHLPQVAAFADHHYQVEKSIADGRTKTSVRLLDIEERVQEMARMLGGRTITEVTLHHAREMIHEAATT